MKRFKGLIAIFIFCLVFPSFVYSRPSSYPTGFRGDVYIRGVPILNTYPGKVFWVSSVDGAAGNSGARPDQALATIDAAIGKTQANAGDIIIVKANHAETITADSGIDIDVAGVSIVGLAAGENRATVTFTTIASADFKIAAANVSVQGLVFKCNIASQDMMIEVTGDDAEIANCDFREGTATGLTFITVGVADNDADRAWIHDNKFHMPTAGNGDAAISIAKNHLNVVVEQNDIYGDFDLAGIDIPAGGNAQVNCQINNNVIVNLLTGQHAIQVNGTGSTGKLISNRVQTDAQATSIDAGGLESYDNLFHIGTDQVEAVPALPVQDGTDNIHGTDNNNNAYASTSVVVNRDGSQIERSEAAIAGLYDAVTEPPTAKSLHDSLHKDGSYTYDNTTDSLEATADAVASVDAAIVVIDAFHDVGTADATTNVVMSDVVGNKADAAATVASTKSLTAYAKQNVNQTLKIDGVTISTTPVAASLASFIASSGTSLGSQLANTESLVDVLYAANGIVTYPAAQLPASGVSIAEALREVYDQQEKAVSGSTAVMVNGDTLFTIANGPIEILSLVSECISGNDGTGSTLQYTADPTVGSATTFSGASGSLASVSAGSGVVLNMTALATAPDIVDPLVALTAVHTRGIIVGAGVIKIVIGTGSTTGTWKHYLRYRPLARGVTVTGT